MALRPHPRLGLPPPKRRASSFGFGMKSVQDKTPEILAAGLLGMNVGKTRKNRQVLFFFGVDGGFLFHDQLHHQLIVVHLLE